jgi:hypothetical protein
MRFKRRRLLTLALTVPVLLAVLVVALWLWADDAARQGLEWVSTEVLDVNVTVADVDLSLLRRRLRLQDVVIDNPPGYQTDNLLHLREGSLVADPRTLKQDPLHLHHLLLDGMTITVEQADGVTNLWTLLERIPQPYDPNYPKTRPLRIDLLEIRNVVVRTKLTPLPGEFDVLEFKLPPLRMERIGYDGNTDVAVLTSRIFMALSEAIFMHIGGSAGHWLTGGQPRIDSSDARRSNPGRAPNSSGTNLLDFLLPPRSD